MSLTDKHVAFPVKTRSIGRSLIDRELGTRRRVELILSNDAYVAAGMHRWPRPQRQARTDVVGGRRANAARVVGCSRQTTRALGHRPTHEPVYVQPYPELARNAVKRSHPVLDAQWREVSQFFFADLHEQTKIRAELKHKLTPFQKEHLDTVIMGNEKSAAGRSFLLCLRP